MKHLRLAYPLALVMLAACPEVENDDSTPGADAGPPPVSYTVSGTYPASGTWDLSGPFTEQDGIGGVVADLVIEKVVGAAGVPSALEDEAIDWVSDRVRAPVRDFVNGRLPETLRPGGDAMTKLAATFASVQNTSSFELSDAGSDGFTGTQRFTSFSMSHDGDTKTVDVAELLEDTAATSIAATTSGSRSGLSLTVDPRLVQVRFGRLVSIAGKDLLNIDIDALTAQAAAIDCSGVVNTLTGGADSYTITVGGMDFSVSASTIADGCASIASSMASKVLGLFSADTPVELGGPVSASDSDGDTVIDGLTSRSGYGGEIIAGPDALHPKISARFSASRQ